MPTTADGGDAARAGNVPPVEPGPGVLVFTDLDGTLLRHEDYDASAARPALEALARRGIPVVLASSKTRAEIELWRSRLGLDGPFISENGGALYVPARLGTAPLEGAEPAHGYARVRLGADIARLRRELASVSAELGVALRGFGAMDAAEVARLTGLSGEDLERSRDREYDEPFVPSRPLAPDEEARLDALAASRGLRVTRGGRFHHLIGASSKGEAARRLISALRCRERGITVVAVGDGANDLELLREADLPVVVARPGGEHARALHEGLPHARFTRGEGPEGFSEAILEILASPAAGAPPAAGRAGSP